MGFEVTYQAIPQDCGLIELARAEADIAASLALVPLWFRRPDGGPRAGREYAEHDSRLWAWCCRLATRHPDLHARNCSLDRQWDKLHYLLSATRRGEPSSPSDRTLDCAFDAGEIVAPDAIAGQGVPVRYLNHETVRRIAALVEQRDHAALARQYVPEKMAAEGVYKFHADRADAAEWQSVTRTFDEFRRFFLEAAARGDAVVLVQD